MLEWLPFPRRFSRVGIEARQQRLTKLSRSRLRPYRDLALLAKVIGLLGYAADARVAAAVGYESGCALRAGEPAPAPAALGDLEPPGEGEDCDVVIVGSGAGGAAAAATLAEAGLDVIVLEAGAHLDRDSYPAEPLSALRALYRDGGLTIAAGRPPVPIPIGRAVGGTTVINSGTCFRAPDSVLGDWRERHGIEWADALGPRYEEAERVLHVTPVDVETMGRNGQLCMEGAAAIGASGGPIARNAGPCVQCSSCPLGCRLDAKRAMHVSYLPRAVAAGARIRAGVEVERVLIEDGRAVGVRGNVARGAHPRDGATAERSHQPPFEVRAKAVISAGGAIGTPELLLRSGISNPHLGRHLHVHPAAWIGARYEQEVRGWEGIMQSYYVDEWSPQGLILEATFTPLSFGAQWLPGIGDEHQRRLLAFDQVASIGVHLSDRSEGRVRVGSNGEARLSYRLSNEEANTIQFGIARAAEIHFAAGATEVYPQVGPVEVIEPGRLADFEALRLKPADLRLEAFHPMGTARMDADPAAGVVSPEGAVHGVEALYVADASVLPSSLGVNPMMTIIATATELASRLASSHVTQA